MFRDMGRDIERAEKAESRKEGREMNEKKERTKKNITLNLTIEKTEYVRKRLKESGMSLSNVVDTMIGELYANFKGLEKRSPAEMSAEDFLDELSTMLKKMKGKYKD